jgi:putative endonuclease
VTTILSRPFYRARCDGGFPKRNFVRRILARHHPTCAGPIIIDVIPNRREAAVRNLLFAVDSTMPEEKLYYVYILASKSRVIYVGMTAFLMNRVLSHRAGEGGMLTRKYRIHRLVYYEAFHNVAAAIARETEIKKWRREKKVSLTVQKNPTWEDLSAEWGTPAVMRVRDKAGSSPPLRAGSE